jgi:amidohydrolase
MSDERSESIFAGVGAMLEDLEELYKDVHRHPELSMQEERTAALAAERLQTAGFEVTTGVGRTGVVGLLRNGDGPTVMLRADMDALPVQEQTGLDYASETDGMMHACGHDMHVVWLAGAAAQLSAARGGWRGTLMAVFQPAEETAAGRR